MSKLCIADFKKYISNGGSDLGKMELFELAKNGLLKFYNSLRNFFKESEILNEIYDLIDKKVFLPASKDERYRYIEDIKEDDIFDRFIDMCVQNASLGIDISLFVSKYYKDKTDEARAYIIYFYESIAHIIFDVLKSHCSIETKLIIKGQEIATQKILERLAQIFTEDPSNVLIVTYSANMQDKNWSLCRSVSNRIDISMKNFPLMPEDKDSYWEIQRKSLVETFNKKIEACLDEGYTIDLYALAPIPLLVQLGNLFANRPNINLFQLKKVPSSFEWEDFGNKLNIKIEKPSKVLIKPDVALMLSFSDKVNINNVRQVVGREMPVVEMSIEEPYDDFLRSKNQLNEFLMEYRKVKAFLTSNGVKRIHLFAAIPVTFAIGIGQAYNPNYDADIITYDFKQGSYHKALTIGGKYGS